MDRRGEWGERERQGGSWEEEVGGGGRKKGGGLRKGEGEREIRGGEVGESQGRRTDICLAFLICQVACLHINYFIKPSQSSAS